jgi:hypothetical protein
MKKVVYKKKIRKMRLENARDDSDDSNHDTMDRSKVQTDGSGTE